MSASPAAAAAQAGPAAHTHEGDLSVPPHVHVRATPRERRLAEIGVLATVAIWSANFVVVKSAIGVLGPLSFTALRYGVAATTLLAILYWRTGSLRVPAGHRLQLFAMGAMGFGAYQVLWTLGLTRITAGDSALIVAAAPVLTALLAGAVGMDRLSVPKVGGALIAFAGVAVVVAGGTGFALGSSLVGDALTFGSACLWAVYTTLGARIMRTVDPLTATAWTVVAGAVVLAPLGAWELLTAPPPAVTVPAVVGVLYSGAFAAGIANVFVFQAIRLVGPTRVTASQFLVPAGAVVLGAVFLAEPVGLAQVAGGLVIVLGVWLTRRASILPLRRVPGIPSGA